jgi:peptidoglycan/LPS O-acetylase OafA/YrhL
MGGAIDVGRERNLRIDALRGFSILLVMFGHSLRHLPWWTQDFYPAVAHQIVTSAYYGVTVFFVISGFLITGKFLRPGDALHLDLRRFYVQRIGRIIPPLALLVVVTAAVAIHYGAPIDISKMARGLLLILQFNFGEAAALMPHTESAYDPLWSLAIEETFYVFLPLVCLLVLTRSRLVAALSAGVVIGFLWRSEPPQIYTFFGTFDELAPGCRLFYQLGRGARDIAALFRAFKPQYPLSASWRWLSGPSCSRRACPRRSP